MQKAFDSEKYILAEKERIEKTISKFSKVYFELGGKLFDDHHASRVLPSFKTDDKLKIFSDLSYKSELIICVNSENIENGRIRSDYNIPYTEDCIRLIREYRKLGFLVSGVALTVFNKQPKAVAFSKKLEEMGEKVYFLKYIPDYPNDEKAMIKAFEESDYIQTTRPLVIMISSGSASGKLSACLCQIYKDKKAGRNSGYAKYDLFPVWNLPLNHPVNLAFMAATADSCDKLVVDTFYLEKYNKVVTNYNRDLNLFPTIKKILGNEMYSSPTEMVINTMTEGFVDEEAICKAAKSEICRRYLTYYKQYLRGNSKIDPVYRVKQIMEQNNILLEDLKTFKYAKGKGKIAVFECGFEGKMLEAKESEKFSISAVIFYTALKNKGILYENELEKAFANIEKKLYIKDIFDYFRKNNIEYDNFLKGCNVHISYLVSKEEEAALKSLGFYFTCCDPTELTEP